MDLDPRFLTVDEVILIHGASMRRYSNPGWTFSQGIRDRNALESAVFAPQATFDGRFLHEGLAEMAAALWHSLTTNHPFIDGNKRVGLAACSAFLRLNGYRLDCSVAQAERTSMKIASGKASRDEVVSFVGKNVERL